MTAIISSTYDSKYFFFIPIVSWCWRKLGCNIICFLPQVIPYMDEFGNEDKENKHYKHVLGMVNMCSKFGVRFEYFIAPNDKEATYAQCSRLMAASLDLPEDEVLITSDVDMAVFKIPDYDNEFNTSFSIFGADLVPPQQYPICYLIAKVRDWRKAFQLQYGAMSEKMDSIATIERYTYQEKLDQLLGHIQAEHFRGNYWGKDQEEAYLRIVVESFICTIKRTNGQNQFATKRYDRDDAYILDRLNPDTVDFHMNRPGFEDANFGIIMKVLNYHFPNDDLQWIRDYQTEYKKLL